MFRLVRGTGHILDVLDVLHRDRLALRIHDGACSAVDLTARSPRTGELLSTVKFMVQTLPAAAAGALQRDLQREPAYDGLRADRAEGSKGGHRGGREDRRRTHRVLEGRPIAALARDHGVSRGAIRLGLRRDDLRLVCGGGSGVLSLSLESGGIPACWWRNAAGQTVRSPNPRGWSRGCVAHHQERLSTPSENGVDGRRQKRR